MLLHLLGIFDANLPQHYLFLQDLQSFDRTCSKEPDQITVLCDVHQHEDFQCMYPQSSRSLLEHQGETHQPHFRKHRYCCLLTEKCDGLRDDLLWRFFSFSCMLFHGIRTKSPRTNPPGQNPSDKIPLDKIPLGQSPPRTKSLWTKSPQYILYLLTVLYFNNSSK